MTLSLHQRASDAAPVRSWEVSVVSPSLPSGEGPPLLWSMRPPSPRRDGPTPPICRAFVIPAGQRMTEASPQTQPAFRGPRKAESERQRPHADRTPTARLGRNWLHCAQVALASGTNPASLCPAPRGSRSHPPPSTSSAICISGPRGCGVRDAHRKAADQGSGSLTATLPQ